MKNNAVKVNQADNVAIAIKPLAKGDVVTIDSTVYFPVVHDIAPSHKIALADIKAGGRIIRYGEPIVEATVDIHKGEWVHVHNTQPIAVSPAN